MAKVYVTQSAGSGGSVATGVLQLQNGVAMTTTLTAVTDQSNTASPLLLSTTGVQTLSKIQISTADTNYIDAEDNSGNNRFTVGRDPASQQVNVDFASNPGGSTELVGGFRTYVDGTNLSNVVNIRRDGQLQIGSTAASAMYWDNTNNRVGIGTATPGVKLDVHSGADNIAQLNRTGAGKSLLQYLLTGTARWATGFDNTNGNYTIYDAVNATDRVVVTNTGRLGVGTSAPAAPLDVNGDIKTNSNIYIQGNAKFIYANTGGGSVTTGLYFRPVDSLLDVYINGTAALTFGASTRTLIKGSGSTSATTSLLVQNSAGTAAMTIKDDLSTNLGGNLNLVYNSSYISASGGGNSATTFVANTSAGWNGFAFGNSSLSYFAEIRTDRTNVYTPLFVTLVGNSSSSPPPTPNASAILQADSNTKGFLPPRMTNAQRLVIATPAVGLMVYCTDAVEGLYVYKSTGWTFVI